MLGQAWCAGASGGHWWPLVPGHALVLLACLLWPGVVLARVRVCACARVRALLIRHKSVQFSEIFIKDSQNFIKNSRKFYKNVQPTVFDFSLTFVRL